MLHFEAVTEGHLDIVKEMVNSNREYNLLENGEPIRTDEELKEEFLHSDSDRVTYFIKADDTYIGLLDYMEHNERDGYPWLGLLMIHHDYQGYGYGTNAYYALEAILKEKGKTALRLGVLPTNEKAHAFWKSIGFTCYTQKETTKGILVDCMEKAL
ncbi:GNAT family N-acetyltransferase [Bacillus sp. 165]|uniref:GNAT family N-acetyltransferase n=1 Tax=Bacillus sp. 165 TaxID=1529117 RepID=UPI001AD9C278|nr:GNAT family N-acetyltransferase [Bacillus sp. 165]MBO9129332.1 GNAT family N-acetyltransferase [Bacillus sp. 165]